MTSIPHQVEELSQDVVMLYPRSFATPLIQGKSSGSSELGRIIAVPLPYDYQPSADQAGSLADAQLVWHSGQYYIIAPSVKDIHQFFWTLNAAYVFLGFLPPALIANLHGEIHTEEDLLVVAACKRSLSLARDDYAETLRDFCRRFNV